MTILFKDDWKKYPKAVADIDTPNKSFLRFAMLLKEMGVENHLFCLSTLDPDLIGKDPYDPNITPETALKMAIEAKRNFWWFLRNCARDPAGSNEFPILFNANRGIMSTYWLFFNHVLTFLIMIRQTGKSFGVDWLTTYLINVRLTKTEISYLTKDEKLRGRSVDRLKGIETALPPFLKQRSNRDPGNTEVFKVSALDNSIKLYVPNRSPKLADLVGRGMTSPITVVDEFAYIHNNAITIPVMLSATLAAREVAALKNEPYGNIFMTTSGKRDTPEGRYAYNFMQSCAIWSESFYDAPNIEELHKMILKAGNGKDLRVNCTFNHRQLGKSDQWLKDRLRESAQEDPIQIKADFLNEWPSGTTSSPFPQEIAEAMRASEVLDHYLEIAEPEAYALRWYYKEEEIKHKLLVPHVLGSDPSEAIGSDAIGLTLRNVLTGEVAMAADITEGNLIAFCRWLGSFLQKYPTVTLIIERRSTGAMIIDYLLEFLPSFGIDPFKRIYNQIVQFHEEFPDRFKEIQTPFNSRENLYLKYKKYFGWATSGTGTTSRSELFSRTLNSATKMTGTLMKDRKLILQTLGLEIRNGRIDHQEGEHDDLCFSWLLSFWLISLGKNLRYYGIDPSKVLSENPVYHAQLKVVSAYEQSEALKAREDVERLTQQLKDESDEYVARRLEYDLERAISKLSDQDRQIVSADDLINKLRDERTRNVRRPYIGSGEGSFYRSY